MVFPCGAVINALVIVAGSSVGLLVGSRLPERLQTLIFQLFGLCLLAIGLKMTLGDTNILIVILSAVLGAATGELFRLSQRLDALAERLKKKVNSQNPLFSQGLVSGSVMVCAGAMALVGSFEEGLGLGRTTVFAKTMIDFFATLILASRTGAGVIFASVAVLVYQGGLTILAAFLSPLLGPAINCLQSVGGLLVMAIGLNMLGLRPAINISNSLPAILFAAFLPLLMETLGV
ncbi:MAG: DUF554 domain-containing protein [Deltaproteobacteria bacterium]|nr:DUF554 domain-containing protein [Deltaproteobacteria bacterium]